MAINKYVYHGELLRVSKIAELANCHTSTIFLQVKYIDNGSDISDIVDGIRSRAKRENPMARIEKDASPFDHDQERTQRIKFMIANGATEEDIKVKIKLGVV